jgi:fructose-bisphosphate aldolase class II
LTCCNIRYIHVDIGYGVIKEKDMALVNLDKMLADARKNRYAVGAFNIFNHRTASAAIRAAEAARSPLILQTSTSTVRNFGPEALIDFLSPLARRALVPVAIHLDHCIDPALARTCIDLGWSSVMIDVSGFPLAENIRITREIVAYAKSRGVTVEGELGAIGGVEDDIAVDEDAATITDPAESLAYCEATGIDAFAPAIGTAHGIYKNKPLLRFDILALIEAASPCPLVVHGGTGLDRATFRRLVETGVAKINVSTAIKMAYMESVKNFFSCGGETTSPQAFDSSVGEKIQSVVREFIETFGAAGRA